MEKKFNLNELNSLFEDSELYAIDYIENTLVNPMRTLLDNDIIKLTEENEDNIRYISNLMIATKSLEDAYDLSANYGKYDTKVHDTLLWEMYTMSRDALLKELGYVWNNGKIVYYKDVK